MHSLIFQRPEPIANLIQRMATSNLLKLRKSQEIMNSTIQASAASAGVSTESIGWLEIKSVKLPKATIHRNKCLEPHRTRRRGWGCRLKPRLDAKNRLFLRHSHGLLSHDGFFSGKPPTKVLMDLRALYDFTNTRFDKKSNNNLAHLLNSLDSLRLNKWNKCWTQAALFWGRYDNSYLILGKRRRKRSRKVVKVMKPFLHFGGIGFSYSSTGTYRILWQVARSHVEALKLEMKPWL